MLVRTAQVVESALRHHAERQFVFQRNLADSVDRAVAAGDHQNAVIVLGEPHRLPGHAGNLPAVLRHQDLELPARCGEDFLQRSDLLFGRIAPGAGVDYDIDGSTGVHPRAEAASMPAERAAMPVTGTHASPSAPDSRRRRCGPSISSFRPKPAIRAGSDCLRASAAQASPIAADVWMP